MELLARRIGGKSWLVIDSGWKKDWKWHSEFFIVWIHEKDLLVFQQGREVNGRGYS
jgi:hypothetical protein